MDALGAQFQIVGVSLSRRHPPCTPKGRSTFSVGGDGSLLLIRPGWTTNAALGLGIGQLSGTFRPLVPLFVPG